MHVCGSCTTGPLCPVHATREAHDCPGDVPGPDDVYLRALQERDAERQALAARAEMEVHRARQEERRRVMGEAEALHNQRMDEVLKAASQEQLKQQEAIAENWQMRQAQVLSWQEA